MTQSVTPMDVLQIIGNILNLIQNIPQVVKTYKTRSTKDFSATFLALRIIGNLIWIAYAIDIHGTLLAVNNSITVAATMYLSYFKVKEMLNDRRKYVPLNGPGPEPEPEPVDILVSV